MEVRGWVRRGGGKVEKEKRRECGRRGGEVEVRGWVRRGGGRRE